MAVRGTTTFILNTRRSIINVMKKAPAPTVSTMSLLYPCDSITRLKKIPIIADPMSSMVTTFMLD